jgi:hypothetical protein
VTLLASGELGSSLRVGINAPAGSIAVPLGALGLGSPTSIPGIGGSLLLDLTTLVLLPPHVMGASEHAGLDVPVPNLPGLTRVHVAFQGAWLTAAAISFGANATHVVLQ